MPTLSASVEILPPRNPPDDSIDQVRLLKLSQSQSQNGIGDKEFAALALGCRTLAF
jgi:hypothetical protein